MASGTPALQSVMGGATRFLGWWGEELRGLVPGRVLRLLADAEADAVLAQVEDGFQVLTEPAGRTRARGPQVLSRAQALAALAKLGVSRKLRRVGIRLPLDRCFERRVELPRAAPDDLRRMLNFDLERATPFRLADVYAAHLTTSEAAAKGKQRVRQLVVKREVVDPLVADLKAAGFEPAFVDCWQGTPASGLSVDFLQAGDPPRAGGRITLTRALALAVLVLGALACALWLSRYESALAEITAQTAEMRKRAGAVRDALDRANDAVADLARLQKMKLDRLPSVEVLEELSRVLPDTVSLIDLRIEGDVVDIAGLAKSGAALPSLFVGSTLFADAALTAPVTFDPREDRERFSLRLRIKPTTASQQASSGKERP